MTDTTKNTELYFAYDGRASIGEKVSDAFTDERFSMWKTNRGPLVLKSTFPQIPRSKIHGVLYLVSEEHLIKLDRLHNTGVHFERKQVKVFLPELTAQGDYEIEMAYCHVAIEEFWSPQIDWNRSFYRGRHEKENYSVVPVRRNNNPKFDNYFSYTGVDPSEVFKNTPVYSIKGITPKLQKLEEIIKPPVKGIIPYIRSFVPRALRF